MTLGRRAYRRPLRLLLAALTITAVFVLTVPEPVRRYGAAGVLVVLAAALWAVRIHRTRLIVTIGEKGVALRRGALEVKIPVSAVDAAGITWPATEPVWTVWFDRSAAPGVEAVAEVDGDAVALFSGASLPSGRLEAARTAAAGILGAEWRVLDDRGEEVPPPAPGALARADRLLVDGTGRFRDERAGTLLAVASGRRRIEVRDPHGGVLLVFRRPSRLPGRGGVRVRDGDGRLAGSLHGRSEPSFHDAGGTLLGSALQAGGQCVVTGVDGRRSAALRAGTGGMALERSPSAPGELRTLALAFAALYPKDRGCGNGGAAG
ncbi:hypothetical protein [Actinomadura darangshiensis]|uniref:hypothetical protein n=1 Tax=Actinomadura darangshiensis TaxID=705336 RepID=UPI00140B3F02|nr:hypothetical protein [Actinomadura darangshiensis]